MSTYRQHLPQLSQQLFLTDGGIETTLIFHNGLDLPLFAAFDLLKSDTGKRTLLNYFRQYADIAKRYQTGLILESATWRASRDWGEQLHYNANLLADANKKAIDLLEVLRTQYGGHQAPVVISGCVGPRGDGYIPTNVMSPEQAEDYHHAQINTFASTSADMICAITMNYSAEAIGIVRAAHRESMPVAISFTVETDGRLPTGQPLKEAIAQVDDSTDRYASYYMINCAHPTHFEHLFAHHENWMDRIQGLRANASKRSHAELNECPDLDDGNPEELGKQYASLKRKLTHLNVLGGCCGTDDRHVESMVKACGPLFA